MALHVGDVGLEYFWAVSEEVGVRQGVISVLGLSFISPRNDLRVTQQKFASA